MAQTGLSYPISKNNPQRKIAPETLKLYRELAERVYLAEAEFEQRMVEQVNRAAMTTNEKTGAPDWRASAFMLTHHEGTRKNWFEHKMPAVIIQNAAGEIPEEHVRIKELSDREVLDLAPDEWRELLSGSAFTTPTESTD
jgi:hypothetical protein